MAGGVYCRNYPSSQCDFLSGALEFPIHIKRIERCPVPRGCCDAVVPPFQKHRVQFVGHDFAARSISKRLGASCVIEMAVRDQQVSYPVQRYADRDDILQELIFTPSAAGIDKSGLCAEVDEVDSRIFRGGEAGAAHLVDLVGDPYGLRRQLSFAEGPTREALVPMPLGLEPISKLLRLAIPR